MVLVDSTGAPLGAYLEAASPAEVTLLETTLATATVGRPGKPGRPRQRPERLIADRGNNSNPLRARLAQRGIVPIIPARSNHKRATHQDGRKLRRDIAGAGLSNELLPGWDTFGASWCALSP